MIQLAVLDLDGTLLDSASQCAAIVNGMLSERASAVRVGMQDARRLVSGGAQQLVSTLLGDSRGDPDRDLAEFRARYAAEPTPESSLFPGVREGLIDLHRAGVTLALCSNKPQQLCEKVLWDLDLAVYFDAIVGSSPDLRCKPDPAHIDRAIELAGGARSASCYVGDSELDYLVAKHAGVPFIFVTYGYAEAGLDPTGALRADGFAAVPFLVAQLLSAAQPADVVDVLRKSA